MYKRWPVASTTESSATRSSILSLSNWATTYAGTKPWTWRSPKHYHGKTPLSRKFHSTLALSGCCYGKDDKPDKGDYLKLCGQRFWEFISGNEHLYTDIIEPLGHKAKEKNEQFQVEYAKVVNRFTLEFSNEYCAPDGSIVWDKLVRFNSGKSAK